MKKRGAASLEKASAKGHIIDWLAGTEDARYDRKGEIEYHAHSGGEEDTGIEGKLLTEDFYETRGDYDHDKESFATPIDTRYFATQAAKRATEKLISQRTEQKKEVVQNVTDQQPSGLWSKIFNIADKADKQ